MTLYRNALGYVIRDARLKRGMNLRDVATKAPMSLGYLSEVERGQKELSSEFIILIAKALGTTVSALAFQVAVTLEDWEQQEANKQELQELLATPTI